MENMWFKRFKKNKIILFVTIVSLVSNSLVFAGPLSRNTISKQTLTPQLMEQVTQMTETGLQSVESKHLWAKHLYMLSEISSFLLEGGITKEGLNDELMRIRENAPGKFKNVKIDLDSIEVTSDNIIYAEFDFEKERMIAEIRVSTGTEEDGWEKIDRTDMKITKYSEEQEKIKGEITFMEEQMVAGNLEEYQVYHITENVLKGNIDNAVMHFFTSVIFQEMHEKLENPVKIINKFLKVYQKDKIRKDNIKNFAKEIINKIIVLTENTEEAVQSGKDLQIMFGQMLTVMSWIDEKVFKAEKMRLTVSKEKIISSEKGESFIDKDFLPGKVEMVEKEGLLGFYWRGIEGIDKLGKGGIQEGLIYDKDIFDANKDKLVMYLMDHGFVAVPDERGNKGLLGATKNEIVTTLHETYFVNDFLPGSTQTTSTGPGHFQRTGLDIKQVIEGKGVQFNVLYDEKGTIIEVLAQEIEAGSWTMALPGYVDYMVNLGGLRFNDISIKLTPDEAEKFNPIYAQKKYFRDKEMLTRIGNEVKEKSYAPYIGAEINGEKTIIKTGATDIFKSKWLPSLNKKNIIATLTGEKGISLKETYGRLTEKGIVALLAAQESILFMEKQQSIDRTIPFTVGILDEEGAGQAIDKKAVKKEKEQTLNKAAGIKTFIEDSEPGLQKMFAEIGEDRILLRIPVELIQDKTEQIKGFLKNVTNTGKVYVEIFNGSDGQISTGLKAVYEALELDRDGMGKRPALEKKNTVTLLPVFKGEKVSTSDANRYWSDRGISFPKKTIIAPVGKNYDSFGIVRSCVLGFKLLEIARNENYDRNSEAVIKTLEMYEKLCLKTGPEELDFNLNAEDLLKMARGSFMERIEALNKLIKLLPIVPLNINEKKEIQEIAESIEMMA